MDESQLLFSLIRNEICGQPLSVKAAEQLSPQLQEKLYVLAAKHDLAHIPAEAMSKLEYLQNEGIGAKLKNAALNSFGRYVQQNHLLQKACKVLEAAQIPFIPLKGAVLRQYYPEPWLRTSCDIDILVPEEQLEVAVESLVSGLPCERKNKTGHDVQLLCANHHIELHYNTIESRSGAPECLAIMEHIWDMAHPKQTGSYHYCLTDEMFYFYHIAHMAKHFDTGGCGIRSFLDVWILNHKVSFDRPARYALLEQGKLLKFAQAAEKLAEFWFSDTKPEPEIQIMSDYILRAGAYGNSANRAALGHAKMGGKTRYLLQRRIFIPYTHMINEFPVLKKHKWLFPVYQIVRWFKMLLRGNLGRTIKELQANNTAKDADIREADILLKYLEL